MDSPTAQCPNPCCSRRRGRRRRARSGSPATRRGETQPKAVRPAPLRPGPAHSRLGHAPSGSVTHPARGEPGQLPKGGAPRRRAQRMPRPRPKARCHPAALDRLLKGPRLGFQNLRAPLILPTPAPPRTVLPFCFPFNHSLTGQNTKTPPERSSPTPSLGEPEVTQLLQACPAPDIYARPTNGLVPPATERIGLRSCPRRTSAKARSISAPTASWPSLPRKVCTGKLRTGRPWGAGPGPFPGSHPVRFCTCPFSSRIHQGPVRFNCLY